MSTLRSRSSEKRRDRQIGLTPKGVSQNGYGTNIMGGSGLRMRTTLGIITIDIVSGV